MNGFRTAFIWAAAAIAIGAIAAWPFYVRASASAAHAASLPSAAPVTADYLERDALIAFWERAAGERRRGDMLSPTNLSAQYMQRYRERGDIGDVVRSMDEARRALRAQPYGNAGAEIALGSALVALHRFKDALAVIHHVEQYDPGDRSMLVREASVDLEIGRYGDAGRIVAALEHGADTSRATDVDTLLVRYDELTGRLARARERFERTAAYGNAHFDAPAQQRAWLAVRSGELAFEAGDVDGAVADERQALDVFPNYSEANRLLARFECARHAWAACAAAAAASARVVPYPEVLGYLTDAQRALGDAPAAQATDDLIATVGRVGGAQHVTDRLLAIYDCEHDEHLEDAYRIARDELRVRDDIVTDDTLAWAAAKTGRWDEARLRIGRALRFDTENALLQYHAGAIAQHFGDLATAKRRFERALALNPVFHPFYADDARARLRSGPLGAALVEEGR